jgi:hypothetical protein
MTTFFYYAAGVIFGIGLIVSAYVFIDKSRKKAYERDFHFLFSCVSYYVVDKHNFDKICALFRRLRLNEQDIDRTNALWSVFQTRYNEYFQDYDLHNGNNNNKQKP